MAIESLRDVPERRALALAVSTAVITGALAVVGAAVLHLPLHDPDGFLGPAWLRMPLIVAACLAVDVLPRATSLSVRARRAGDFLPAVWRVGVQRWPLRRLVPVLVAVASFYVTYVGYRNLKNFLPFVFDRSDDLELVDVDRALTFGHNPAAILHDLLGTGASAYVLSYVYTAFLVLVPISVAVALVWSKRLSHGLWYVTALCLNWALGVVSYYLVPSSGPFYVLPWDFVNLPHTDATALQQSLLRNRAAVVADPHAAATVSGIAAFASLHVSVTFTAALIVHLTSTRTLFRRAAWTYFVLVALSTVYFGWHYLSDDIAGLLIGAVAVWSGAWATGNLRAPARPSVLAAETSAGRISVG
jgi:membrane-associated phospholipid phosphatase